MSKKALKTRLFCMIIILLSVFAFMGNQIVRESINKSLILREYKGKDIDKSVVFQDVISCFVPIVGFVDDNYTKETYLKDYTYESDAIYAESSQIFCDEENDLYRETSDGLTYEMSEQIADETPDELSDGTTKQITDETPDELSEGISEEITDNISEQIQNSTVFRFSELCDFNTLIADNYTIAPITDLTKDKFDVKKALLSDLSITQDNSAPQILIFHTHSQEAFKDSVKGDAKTSIVAVGDRLADILSNKYGYNVIHDTTVYDYVNGKLDRSKAYTYAEEGIKKILDEYPSIEVVIDLHRDGVKESVHLVKEINGKSTAKIMLFNGISYTKVKGNLTYLTNPHIQGNLASSLQLYLLGKRDYGDLFRKIYVNGYRYCFHYRDKSFLVEVGAQNNSLEEEFAAMEPLADCFDKLLKGDKAYSIDVEN